MCSPEIMARVQRELGSGARINRRNIMKSALAASAAAGIMMPTMRAQDSTPIATPLVEGPLLDPFVDMTHLMDPNIPVWPGNESFEAEVVKSFENDGFYAQKVSFWEHTGTHVDSPAHFSEGNITADKIEVSNLFAPLAVIDISARAAEDADAAMSVDDILAYEATYGELPAGALVAMYSGWEDKWDDAEAFVNLDDDGVQHYPGIHPDAAEFLVTQRDIVGIAVDTLSQDPGNSTDFGTHITILGAGKYGIEGIANLAKMAAAGSSVFVGAPKHENASGGPARILGMNRAR